MTSAGTSSPLLVGLDVGTSVVKAVGFDGAGEVLAVESVRSEVLRPGGARVEQDAEAVVAGVFAVLARLLARMPAAPAVIGVTGQGDGLWLVDAEGRAAGPALSWMDGRAASVVERWMADGTFAELFARTGNAPFPGAGAPLLAALDADEPERLDAATTAARCKDVVLQRLTGVRATDPSDASNLFTDIRTGVRDPGLLARCGLGHRAFLLPPVLPAPGGPLLDEAAAALAAASTTSGPRAAGVPVVAAPYDLPSSALGAGVTAPGDGLLIVGTTLACQVVADAVDTTGEAAGQTLLTGTPGRWLRAMPAMTGTAALDWVLGLAGATHDQVDALLGESPVGARGVRALPYLSPAGERAPFVEPAARGRLDGLELATSRADVVRAVCESLAFAARHCFDAAGLTGEVAVCGGGAGSRAWLQVLADTLQRPLRVARGPQVGARGAVLAAAAASGIPLDTAAWTASSETIDPDPRTAAAMEDGFARYVADVARARTAWADARPAATV